VTTTTYSRRYWKLIIDGYTELGKEVPQEAIDGLAAAEEAVASAADGWMQVDDAGRELARIAWAESGNKPWAKMILDPTVQALNIFKNGTTAKAGLPVMAPGYLAIKAELDQMWAVALATHKHTQAFMKLMEAMEKHGRKNHSFPRDILKAWCDKQGWLWTPQMGIGTGTTVHLTPSELPDEDCLVTVTTTLLAVIDGHLMVPNDLYIERDITRAGQRAVYGWWTKP
jgi:hypothetical protein